MVQRVGDCKEPLPSQDDAVELTARAGKCHGFGIQATAADPGATDRYWLKATLNKSTV